MFIQGMCTSYNFGAKNLSSNNNNKYYMYMCLEVLN